MNPLSKSEPTVVDSITDRDSSIMSISSQVSERKGLYEFQGPFIPAPTAVTSSQSPVRRDARSDSRSAKVENREGSVKSRYGAHFVTIDTFDPAKASFGEKKNIVHDISVQPLIYEYDSGPQLFMLSVPRNETNLVYCQDVGKRLAGSGFASTKNQCVLVFSKDNRIHTMMVEYIISIVDHLSSTHDKVRNPVIEGKQDWRIYTQLMERSDGTVVTKIYDDSGVTALENMKGSFVRPGLLFQSMMQSSEGKQNKCSLKVSLSHVYVSNAQGNYVLRDMDSNP